MPRVETTRPVAPENTVGALRADIVLSDDHGRVGGARISNGNLGATIVVDLRPDADLSTVAPRLLEAALAAVAEDGGGPVHWWAAEATAEHVEIATAVGLAPGRRLLQMRRALPTGLHVEVSTRAFRPSLDEVAWVEVNNRAFAGHPEQGGWTVDTLRRREEEPWFDPDGFRLHERDGRLAAFCWTKLHDDPEVMGEIYVIGVDPAFQRLGLGRQLTLAGLEWIAERGVPTAMLYVDAANDSAVAMYERLGFTVHHVDRAFTASIEARIST